MSKRFYQSEAQKRKVVKEREENISKLPKVTDFFSRSLQSQENNVQAVSYSAITSEKVNANCEIELLTRLINVPSLLHWSTDQNIGQVNDLVTLKLNNKTVSLFNDANLSCTSIENVVEFDDSASCIASPAISNNITAGLAAPVSTLTPEGVIGFLIPNDFVKHHVSIQSRKNFSDIYNRVCAGAIVSDNFIVGGSFCFVDKTCTLLNESFSVVVGTNNLSDPDSIRVNILKIYLPGFDPEFEIYNLAVVQLKFSLDVHKNPRLCKLKLPEQDQTFEGKMALLSGYGYEPMSNVENNYEDKSNELSESTRDLLKVAFVQILSEEKCQQMHWPKFNDNHMCGIMSPQIDEAELNICKGDIGAPLTIQNILVGIADINIMDCYDSEKGARYIKISNFARFIKNVVRGRTGNDTIVFDNLSHIPNMDTLTDNLTNDIINKLTSELIS